MAYAPFSNNQIQLGREGTKGTVAAATTKWRGPFSMPSDARTRNIVEEQIGAFMQAERSYDAAYLAKWAAPSCPLTYEQILHVLEAGVKTTTPSGGGPYTWLYSYPYTGVTVNTIKTYTVEAGSATITGDNQRMEFGFVEQFELSGKFGEAWMMQSNWLGRQLTPSITFTAGQAAPTVEEALFNKTVLSIGATGGAVAQVNGVLMAAKITVKTGLIIVPVANGQLYFQDYKWTQPEIKFSITFELEDGAGTVTTERGIYNTNAVRLFRLKTTGSGSKSMQLDWAGKYDTFGDYTNASGDTTVTVDGHVVASSADSLAFAATIVNSIPSSFVGA